MNGIESDEENDDKSDDSQSCLNEGEDGQRIRRTNFQTFKQIVDYW